MKVPYRWLKEFVSPLPAAEKLATILTEQGIEVARVEQKGKGVSGVIVGLIEHLSRHPNADKLQICRVNVQNKILTIVTGATNVAVGQKVPVAVAGAKLATGITIVPKPLRGQLSDGMLCSGEELGIGNGDLGREDGIWILSPDAPLGADVGELLGFGETVFDIDVLPNRSDCLSIRGIAREVAAGTGAKFRPTHSRIREGKAKITALAKVRVEAKSLCPRYMARVIEGVRVAPSPRYIQERLQAAGIRPIHNVVDVTNYVLLELGQPLHAFDLDRLSGRQIIVRKQNKNEKIKTLDGVERVLPEGTLVIADAEHPVAIAGVMGGENTEIREETSRILLESAFFDSQMIHRVSRELGLRSESSIRFAAGVSWDGVEEALDRATLLIQEVAGGEVARGKIDVSAATPKANVIRLTASRVSELTGMSTTVRAAAKPLQSLGFTVTSRGDTLTVRVPDYRSTDVKGVEDLVEEIVRLGGFQKLPTRCLPFPGVPKPISRIFSLRRLLAEIMTGSGFQEVTTYAMVDPAHLKAMRLPEHTMNNLLMLKNPLREEMSVMRPNLLVSLLSVASYNVRHQENQFSLFEIGRSYQKETGHIKENDVVAGVTVGRESFYLIKGMLSTFLRTSAGWELLPKPIASSEAYPYYHPGQSATFEKDLSTGTFQLAWGKLHPAVAESFELQGPVFVFEMDLGALVDVACPIPAVRPLPEYPAAFRDLSFIISDGVPYQVIDQTIRGCAGSLLDRAELFDRYQGKQIPSGHVSLTFRIAYRKADGTLTDAEVQSVHKGVCDGLRAQCQAQIRES